MKSVFAIVLCIYSLFAEIETSPDRVSQLKYLNAEYVAATEIHRGTELSKKVASSAAVTDTADLYLPKYLKLAEESPDDEVALEACQWIASHSSQERLQQKAWLDADEKCWKLIAKHHYFHPEIASLVLTAGENASLAREAFLENLPYDWTQSVEVHGHALLSLAGLKVQKYNLLLKAKAEGTSNDEVSEEWATYMADNTLAQIAGEINVLYSDVLTHYSHITIAGSAEEASLFATLGEQARAGVENFERKLMNTVTAPLADAVDKKKINFATNSNGG
jgi:hypothetical protein